MVGGPAGGEDLVHDPVPAIFGGAEQVPKREGFSSLSRRQTGALTQFGFPYPVSCAKEIAHEFPIKLSKAQRRFAAVGDESHTLQTSLQSGPYVLVALPCRWAI